MVIASAEYRGRVAELLRDLGETEWGRMAAAVVRWARRQVEAERTA